VDDNQRTAFPVEDLPGLTLVHSKAAGLIGCSSMFTATRHNDVNAWSQSLDRWSRNIEIYGVVFRPVETMPRTSSIDGESTEILRALLHLIWRQDCFVKPTVTLLHAPVSGPVMALAVAGTHRVAGPNFRFALPAPQAGATLYGLAHFYAAMPKFAGTYLALTSASIGPADAYHLGLVTHCVETRHFEAVVSGIEQADPVDPLVDDLHRDAGDGEVIRHGEMIARCFSASTVAEIRARLDREAGEHKAFAQQAKTAMAAFSIADLEDRLALIRRATAMDLRAALIDDFSRAYPTATPLTLVARAELQAPRT
jgi:enoyl-CoA hydratase